MVTVLRKKGVWEIKPVLEALPKQMEKQFEGGLCQDFVDEPRVIAAEFEGVSKLDGLNRTFTSGTTERTSGNFC